MIDPKHDPDSEEYEPDWLDRALDRIFDKAEAKLAAEAALKREQARAAQQEAAQAKREAEERELSALRRIRKLINARPGEGVN